MAVETRKPQQMPVEEMHIDDLLRETVDLRATDLHIGVGLPPIVRVDGHLQPLPYTRFTPPVSQRICYDILTDEQIQQYENEWPGCQSEG